MYARCYRFKFTQGSFDEALVFFDESALPMIESLDGHLGVQSVKISDTESMMFTFYRDKAAADNASAAAGPLFEKFAQWLSTAPEVVGEGEVLRSLNLGY